MKGLKDKKIFNSEKIDLEWGGMKFQFADVMEKLNEAGLLPQPKRDGDNKVKYITRYEGQYKLCFIRGSFAYFTLKPLQGEGKQWGDDWDDAPYQHNAGLPYDREKMVKIAYYFPNKSEGMGYELPLHKNVSVETINCGVHPWINFHNKEIGEYFKSDIWAGDSINEFISKIHETGGEIYTKT